MIGLTIRSDAFGMTRIGLARVDYVLSNFYYFSFFETDGIYCVPTRVKAVASQSGLPVVGWGCPS
jgi:hypothetical protein